MYLASAVAVPIKTVMQLHPQKNCTKTSFILTMTATNGFSRLCYCRRGWWYIGIKTSSGIYVKPTIMLRSDRKAWPDYIPSQWNERLARLARCERCKFVFSSQSCELKIFNASEKFACSLVCTPVY